jgi:SOS-response transcriptional repressor LexA
MQGREHEGIEREIGAGAGLHPGRLRHTGWVSSDREIMAHQGVTVRAAYQHVRTLQRKGSHSSTRHHRGIRLSPEHVPPVGLLIIGRVVAGMPILGAENLDRYPEIHRL